MKPGAARHSEQNQFSGGDERWKGHVIRPQLAYRYGQPPPDDWPPYEEAVPAGALVYHSTWLCLSRLLGRPT